MGFEIGNDVGIALGIHDGDEVGLQFGDACGRNDGIFDGFHVVGDADCNTG